jgi:hypothetical protein
LSRVADRGEELTGPRLRGLLALLAGDVRSPVAVIAAWDGASVGRSRGRGIQARGPRRAGPVTGPWGTRGTVTRKILSF